MTAEQNRADDGYPGSPEEAFSILGDETRLSILLELADAGPGEAVSFSELRERVGIEDSGRFNYHLDKLGDGFIERTEEGYIARTSALAVLSAVHAGTYGSDGGEYESESAFDCPECDRRLTTRYETDHFSLECEEHGIVLGYPTPPGAFTGRTLEELLEVVISRMVTTLDLVRQGICPRCWGRTSVEYPVGGEEGGEVDVWVDISCTRCWLETTPPLKSLLAGIPAVRALYDEHQPGTGASFFGPKAVSNPEVCQLTLHEESTVSSTATLSLGGETLVLELDENCQIVEQYRQ